MNKKTVLLLLGGTILVLFIGWFYMDQLSLSKLFFKEKTGEVSMDKNNKKTSLETENSMPKTDAQGKVDVEATLLPEKSKSDFLLFKIALNTHTGDLPSYKLKDLGKISFGSTNDTLGTFDWQIVSEDSHHTVGYLSWKGEVNENRSITLELMDIDEVPSRSFTWGKDEVETIVGIKN
ncbi:MAG: hypothetical protein ABF649_16665 [Bacillus sp. (in: firmicutes)]